MRLEQFEYLIAIHNHKSMHAAARALHTSQQNISKAIKELEEELNVQIFIRTSSGSLLTENGKELLAHATQIQKEIESIKNKFNSRCTNKITCNNLNIYTSKNIYRIIFEYVTNFVKEKNYSLTVNTNSTANLLDMLKSGNIPEFIFIQAPLHQLKNNNDVNANYSIYLLKNEQIKIAVSSNSPLFSKSSISLKALSKIPLITDSFSEDAFPTLTQVLIDNGAKLNIKYQTDVSLSENLLQYYDAATLCTDSLGVTNLRLIPIKEHIYIAICVLIRKKNISDSTALFVENFLSDYKPELISPN